MTTTPEQQKLYEKLLGFVEAGDEQGAFDFVKHHLTEFPKEVQQRLVLSIFAEAVERQSAFAELKEQAAALIDALAETPEETAQ